MIYVATWNMRTCMVFVFNELMIIIEKILSQYICERWFFLRNLAIKNRLKRRVIWNIRCNLWPKCALAAPWKSRPSTRSNVPQFGNWRLHLFSWACHGQNHGGLIYKTSKFRISTKYQINTWMAHIMDNTKTI